MDWEQVGVLAFCAVGIVAMFVRLENRITKLETHIVWLKHEVTKCLQTLAQNTE